MTGRLSRCATGLTALATGLLVNIVVVGTAQAGADRMELQCQDGRVIERSNGSNWWGVGSDSGYVTAHLLITDPAGAVQYEKDYGLKAPVVDRSTCVADHFGSTWAVELVRTR